MIASTRRVTGSGRTVPLEPDVSRCSQLWKLQFRTQSAPPKNFSQSAFRLLFDAVGFRRQSRCARSRQACGACGLLRGLAVPFAH
jgi:hypothetical protein